MRDVLTDLLELVGLVCIAVALSLLTLRWGWDCAAATFGVSLLVVSAIVEVRRPKRRTGVDG